MAVEGGYGSAAQFQLMAGAAAAATGQIGRLVQSIAAVQATVGTITFAARAFATLEQQLTLTNAVAEGTAKNFKEMQTAVQNASLAMKFSAVEGSNALYALASAGLSVQQSISALQGVMVLAQATMTDVGVAADTVAGALSAFQMRAESSTRIANLFAASIAQSQADMPKLAYAFRQVAPVAAASGVSIEQLTASMNTLFNVGLRGEQTGTALRNIITNLASPTKDAADAFIQLGVATQKTNGQARDLFEVLADLSKANPSTATLKTMFGADAMAGAQALLNAANEDGYKKRLATDQQFADRAAQIAKRTGKTIVSELQLNLEGITGTSSAFEIAAKQMATLSGSFSTATNAITLMATQLGQQLAPTLRTVANAVTDAGVAFQGLSDHQKSLVVQLPLIAAGGYAIYRAFGPMVSMFDKLGGATQFVQMFGGNPQARATPSQVAATFASGMIGNYTQLGNAGLRGAAGGLGFIPPTITSQQIADPRLIPQGYTYNGQAVGGTALTAAQLASGRYGKGYNDATGAAVGRNSIPPQTYSLQTTATEVPGTTAFRTNIVGALVKTVAVLGTIGIAAAGTYEIGKLIYDYLKVNRTPSSTMPSLNVGGDLIRQIQSSSLTSNGDAYQRVQTLEGLQKTMEAIEAETLEQNKALIKSRSQAGEGTAAVYNRILPGSGGPDMAALQEMLLGEGGKPLDLKNKANMSYITRQLSNKAVMGTAPGERMTPEVLAELQEQVRLYAIAQKDMDQILANFKEYDLARINLRDAMESSKKLPSYAAGVEKAKTTAETEAAQKLVSEGQENLKRTVIGQRFLQEYERAARDAENQVNRARASMTVNPLEQYVREVIAANYATAKEVSDQAQKAENDIRDKFGSRIAGKGDIANMLSGADFYDTVLNAKGDAYVNKPGQAKQQSVASMIEAGGFSREQILARYDEVVAAAMSRLGGIDEEARGILGKFTKANRRTFEMAIEENQIREAGLLRSARQQSQGNREYVVAMRERLVNGQMDIYKALSAGASEIDPAVGSQQALRELFQSNQNSRNVFRQLEDAFFNKFAPDASLDQRSGTAAGREFDKYKASFNTSLDKLFKVQIGNLIIDAKNARARALDTLRSNASDIKAQSAEIAKELFVYTGDPAFLAEAVTADATAAAAQADRTIAALRDRSRTIAGNIARVQASGGLNMPGVPDVNVPAETQQFQTKVVDLQTAANQKLDEINTTLKGIGSLKVGVGGSDSVGFGTSAPRGDINQILSTSTSRGSVTFTAGDLDKVIRTVYGEAANQGNAGMQAVAEVIRNRSIASGATPTQVVLAKGQFEPWMTEGGRNRMNSLSEDSDKYKNISQIVRGVLEGKSPDVANGATNFYAPKAQAVLGRNAPAWDDGTGVDLGDHRFFRKKYTMPGLPGNGQVPEGVNDNVTPKLTAQTTASREATAAQTALRAEIEKIVTIGGDYSTNLTELLPKLKERGASESQIAQITELVNANSKKLVDGARAEGVAVDALAVKIAQATTAKVAYLSSQGYKAYSQWQLEGQALDAMGKSLERNGSIVDGMQFGLAKARHNVSTDFQLASDAFTSFSDKSAGILSGLISGTEKDWKKSVASMLQDIAAAIMKALILRTILGQGGTGAGGESGGIFGFIGNLFGAASGTGGAESFVGESLMSVPIQFAKGGAFPHAVGDIVGSKQYFPMPGGQTGSIAENGQPEAIMPLARGRGGRLGVEVSMQPSASTQHLTQISSPRGGGGGGHTFSPQFTYAPNIQGGSNSDGKRDMSPQEQRDMEREFNGEMEASFNRFVDKQEAPGGRFSTTRKYG